MPKLSKEVHIKPYRKFKIGKTWYVLASHPLVMTTRRVMPRAWGFDVSRGRLAYYDIDKICDYRDDEALADVKVSLPAA